MTRVKATEVAEQTGDDETGPVATIDAVGDDDVSGVETEPPGHGLAEGENQGQGEGQGAQSAWASGQLLIKDGKELIEVQWTKVPDEVVFLVAG